VSQRRAESTGRVVVVTGASSGIGRATARRLAAEGASLVLAARGAESLAAAARECEAAGAEVLVALTDVSDEDDVRRLADTAVARFGRVDAWVHTAAVVAYGRFEDVPSGVFRQVLDTGIHGTVHAARAALRQFRSQGHGTLVLTGSLLGEIATPYMSSYVTSKWAVRGLARVLSIETRHDDGIHVCVVSPGGVDTPVYLQATCSPRSRGSTRSTASGAGAGGRQPPTLRRWHCAGATPSSWHCAGATPSSRPVAGGGRPALAPLLYVDMRRPPGRRCGPLGGMGSGEHRTTSGRDPRDAGSAAERRALRPRAGAALRRRCRGRT
jgi:NAD(P)-dependent dehydrogenase (short-subunit alcohol dehydrogenase family)